MNKLHIAISYNRPGINNLKRAMLLDCTVIHVFYMHKIEIYCNQLFVIFHCQTYAQKSVHASKDKSSKGQRSLTSEQVREQNILNSSQVSNCKHHFLRYYSNGGIKSWKLCCLSSNLAKIRIHPIYYAFPPYLQI